MARLTSTRRLCWALAVVSATLFAAVPASASQRLGDVNVHDPTLQVNRKGEALVTYSLGTGKVRHVLAWGAVNARDPNPVLSQVQFQVDNSGGWKKYRRLVWKSFRDQCRPFDGPRLVYVVAACLAPDGSYWSLQSWQRFQPLRGFPAFKPAHMKYELHLSHWTGPLADFDVSPNWNYGGQWQGVFGRLRYRGVPVHGFKTPTSSHYDAYARFFYIDTFDSARGPGWKRESAVVTHPNGGFCVSFVPLAAPPGYPGPPNKVYPPANGRRHRVTVMGPGVTPDLQWEGAGLGKYAPAVDAEFNELFDAWLPDDKTCAPER